MIDREKFLKYLKKNNIEDYEEQIISLINETVKKEIGKIKKNNKKEILTEKLKLFKDVFPNPDTFFLPSWIKNDIDNIYIVDGSKKNLINKDGKKYHLNNSLNHLSGQEWTFFLNSVLNTKYSTKGEEGGAYHIRKIHPTPKPPILMKSIIEFFTKENEIVFDYFMGVGGTLLGASMCNRVAIGIDLEEKYINAYKEAANYLKYKINDTYLGDSLQLLKNNDFMNNILNNKKISLILIDPPYGNMMSKEKTGEDMKNRKSKEATPFTRLNSDLGNMNKIDFLEKLRISVESSSKFLKNKGYIVIFIKDMQPKGKELSLLHSDIIQEINKIGNIYYKGLKIWADQTTTLFPYGYPFSYVSNQIHQYILIFRKEE